MVHKIYNQYMSPLARVVYGLQTSWEPVVATVYHKQGSSKLAWSPCNRFIAISKQEVVEILDAVTLNIF